MGTTSAAGVQLLGWYRGRAGRGGGRLSGQPAATRLDSNQRLGYFLFLRSLVKPFTEKDEPAPA